MHAQTARHFKNSQIFNTEDKHTEHSIRKSRSRLPLRQLMHPWRSRNNAKLSWHVAWVSERTNDKDGSLRQSLSYAFRNKMSCCLQSHEKISARLPLENKNGETWKKSWGDRLQFPAASWIAHSGKRNWLHASRPTPRSQRYPENMDNFDETSWFFPKKSQAVRILNY